jgi:hypothetical protein
MFKDRNCNPSLLDIVEHRQSSNSTTPTPITYKGQVLDGSSIVSLILWFIVVLYSSFTSASKGEQLLGSSKEKTSLNIESDGNLKSYFF